MDIRNTREMKAFASQRLGHAREEKRIVAIYVAITLGLSALVTVVNYVLGLQMSDLGGLRNLSSRTMLSTLQSVIPMVQNLFIMCLSVGYMAAMLRVARGQYVSPQTLRLGFDRFWVLLRAGIFQGLLVFAHMFLSIYLGIMIFMVSPLSNGAMELLAPYLADLTALSPNLVLEEAVYDQLSAAIIPAYVICGIMACIFVLPLLYSYRMVNYVIIDKPGIGALAAMRQSKQMMRRNRWQLLKLDVSMWWYYGLELLAMAVCYGDVILPMVGVELPWHEDVSYFLFFGLYLVATFGIYYFLRNRVEVTYGVFYDAVKPEEKQDNGVVLGNIFQM